jgi:hypothetical protein
MDAKQTKLDAWQCEKDWSYPEVGVRAVEEVMLVEATAWWDSLESRDPTWLATATHIPGLLHVSRVRLLPLT